MFTRKEHNHEKYTHCGTLSLFIPAIRKLLYNLKKYNNGQECQGELIYGNDKDVWIERIIHLSCLPNSNTPSCSGQEFFRRKRLFIRELMRSLHLSLSHPQPQPVEPQPNGFYCVYFLK